MIDYDVAIIGGGIAGLSLGASLGSDASTVVIEAEDQPGYHSTGRSAAILAQNYGNTLIRALTAWSVPDLGGKNGERLSKRGLVRIATEQQRPRLRSLYDDMVQDTPMDWITGEEVEARVPILRSGRIVCGFANDNAADIDVGRMVQDYASALRQAGGALIGGSPVTTLIHQLGRWQITLASGDTMTAGLVVNAAGAWADQLAEIAGTVPLGLTPMRRTAVTFDPPAGTDLAALPMTVDADEAFYLKPEAGLLMASPGDETPVLPGDSRPEELDVAICIDRIETAFEIEIRRPRATWSGLRTFAPDRSPLCGWDPEVPGFYWLAGQGGYGVQTAPALARLGADDILGRSGAARTKIEGVSRAALDPARLSTPRNQARQQKGV